MMNISHLAGGFRSGPICFIASQQDEYLLYLFFWIPPVLVTVTLFIGIWIVRLFRKKPIQTNRIQKVFLVCNIGATIMGVLFTVLAYFTASTAPANSSCWYTKNSSAEFIGTIAFVLWLLVFLSFAALVVSAIIIVIKKRNNKKA